MNKALSAISLIISCIALMLVIDARTKQRPKDVGAETPEQALRNIMLSLADQDITDSNLAEMKLELPELIRNLEVVEVETRDNTSILFFKTSKGTEITRDVSYLKKVNGRWYPNARSTSIYTSEGEEREWFNRIKEKAAKWQDKK